jgi:hypothetical protein
MQNFWSAARLIALRVRAIQSKWTAHLLVFACLFTVAGCGSAPDHGDRVPLSGTVTVKGQPLDVAATIFFDPLPGADGVGSAGEVSGGKFAIPAETGPTPGKTYNVKVVTAPGIPAEGTPPAEIKRSQTFEKKVDVPPNGDGTAELKIDFE